MGSLVSYVQGKKKWPVVWFLKSSAVDHIWVRLNDKLGPRVVPLYFFKLHLQTCSKVKATVFWCRVFRLLDADVLGQHSVCSWEHCLCKVESLSEFRGKIA